MVKKTKAAPDHPVVFARVTADMVKRIDRVLERLRQTNALAGRSDAIREILDAGLAAKEGRS